MSERIALVRYGAVPEVARCAIAADLAVEVGRGQAVVVQTHRGTEAGMLLDVLKPSVALEGTPAFRVLRLLSEEDTAVCRQTRGELESEFGDWNRRIAEWGLDLQLIDMDRTLDGAKLILYVLNERGPECTKLALQAAAAGLGLIEVQPVTEEGPVSQPQQGGGCGSGGGGCGCH